MREKDGTLLEDYLWSEYDGDDQYWEDLKKEPESALVDDKASPHQVEGDIKSIFELHKTFKK